MSHSTAPADMHEALASPAVGSSAITAAGRKRRRTSSPSPSPSPDYAPSKPASRRRLDPVPPQQASSPPAAPAHASLMQPSASPTLASPDSSVNYTRTGRISKAKKGLKVHNCECGRVCSH